MCNDAMMGCSAETMAMGEGVAKRGRGRPKGVLGFKKVLEMAAKGEPVDAETLAKAQAKAAERGLAELAGTVAGQDGEVETLAEAAPCQCESNPQPAVTA